MEKIAHTISRFQSLDCATFNSITPNIYGDIIADAGLPTGMAFTVDEIEQVRDQLGEIETAEGFAKLDHLVQDITPLVLIGTRPKNTGRPTRG